MGGGLRCSRSVCRRLCQSGWQGCHSWQVSARLFQHLSVPENAVFHGDDRKKYIGMFPQIITDLTADYPDIPEANNWLAEVMRHNILDGPDTTAKLFLLAHRVLVPNGDLSAAYRMAWCLKMLDGSFLVCDELMRRDDSRKEEDRWYQCRDLGLRAANDGLLLESGLYELLRKYFQQEPYYLRAMDTFQQVTQMAVLGRCLDLRASEAEGEARLEIFTSQYLADIARHMTAYHKIYLPVVLAAAMGACEESLQLSEFSEIILNMGVYGHFQDDVLSYVEGTHSGIDAIVKGRCTWPAVVTLQRATPSQRLMFQKSYGHSRQDDISAIKDIYRRVGIRNLFAIYKNEEIKCLSRAIEKIPDKKIHRFLNIILDMLSQVTAK